METVVYLKESEFDLKKFKLDKDSMIVEFEEVRQTNDGQVKIPHSMNPPFQPHPDLLDLLSRMKSYVLKQYDYNQLYMQRNEESKEDQSKLKEAWQELNKNLTVSGFSISGSDQLKGAVITAKLKTESGTRAMPTGRIVFSSDKLGYEKEVEVLTDELKTEVYACLFENKRAQLDLFQDEAKEVKVQKMGLVS